MSILNYQNLTLTYNEQEILHHIDLMIPKKSNYSYCRSKW